MHVYYIYVDQTEPVGDVLTRKPLTEKQKNNIVKEFCEKNCIGLAGVKMEELK